VSIGDQRAWMFQGWIAQMGLRVRFGVHQTMMPIAGGVTDADTFLLVFLIEADSRGLE